MLLMVEKGIRGAICYSVCGYAKANSKKKKKKKKKKKESSYLQYRGVNNLYDWAMPQ